MGELGGSPVVMHCDRLEEEICQVSSGGRSPSCAPSLEVGIIQPFVLR